jgi:rhodanese-related sulfurtransferase
MTRGIALPLPQAISEGVHVNTPVIRRLDPQQANDLLRQRPEAVLIDVRSRVEHDYVGHPPGSIPIAWKEFPDWAVNPAFADQVRARLRERGSANPDQVPVLLICRSGARSLAAGEELLRRGFIEVYNIEEGFEGDRDAAGHRGTINGWRCRDLPWEQT